MFVQSLLCWFATLAMTAVDSKRSRAVRGTQLVHAHLAVALCLLQLAAAASPSPDTATLQAFQASVDPSLRSLNWTGGDACSATRWIGVSCDGGGNVRQLVLEGMNLTGSVAVLANLTQLRLLSLKDNAFNGSLPEMNQWRNLRHLYLHNNRLSGALPESVAAATRLLRFTAYNNQLTGPIPPGVTNLTHLVTLRLEENQLSGAIPSIQLRNLSDFNVSHNQLAGAIPASLVSFGASAFIGNPLLCGPPLGMVCNGTVPKTDPPTESPGPGVSSEKKKPALSTSAIVAIVLGDATLFLLISFLSVTYYWRKYPRRHGTAKTTKYTDEMTTTESVMTKHAPKSKPSESERSKLVFFQQSNKFELGDLLRASAEMLGKGSFGTAYKAVLENGTIVTVKRMKEVNASSRKDFEQKMETIGKLWHPNVLPLRAYYFAKEEKLLVYDYEPKGSLHSLLHGRGPARAALDWATRLKIALGVAKALRYLHHECGKQKLSHGNIKSSNILLDENHEALLADFGLTLIMNPGVVAATSRVAGYRAPENADSKRVSQAADVYSFGVVMLELLTGKAPAPFHPSEEGIDLPKWVQSVVREEWTAEVFDIELMRCKNVEEDLLSMLQTALLCTERIPERRPKMTVVVTLLEKLSRDPSQESCTSSVCQSPSLSGELTARAAVATPPPPPPHSNS